MPIVEMKRISKSFPPLVLALDNVDFSAEMGEIHCLLGENGAGKTSLMNILYGIYNFDEGEVYFEDNRVDIKSPKIAIDLGIGMVHQHFLQVQQHTVAENIALSLENESPFFPLKSVRKLVSEVSERYGLIIDPDANIWQLSAGEQQRVEIIKVLCRDAKLLILDEPTSILTPMETETLFAALRLMVKEGRTIIFITHKLDEVMALSHRVSVLRKGRIVAKLNTADTTKVELAKLMVGKEIIFHLQKQDIKAGTVILEVKNLNANNSVGMPAFKDITFHLKEKEILGIAGVAGNGQKELIEVLTGLRTATTGEIKFNGIDITNHPPKKIADMGIAHIPEERILRGLVPDLSVSDNLALRNFTRPPALKGFFLDRQEMRKKAIELIKSFNIDTPSEVTPAKFLSGGNIQRLILARELSESPKLIIASHPTYGLDVGATENIRRILLDQKEKGSSILLVSEDLDEILALSDRIAVIYKGRFQKIAKSNEYGIDEIGLLMSGEHGDDSQ
jgi:simple sugar transport system ATP-binding protein